MVDSLANNLADTQVFSIKHYARNERRSSKGNPQNFNFKIRERAPGLPSSLFSSIRYNNKAFIKVVPSSPLGKIAAAMTAERVPARGMLIPGVGDN